MSNINSVLKKNPSLNFEQQRKKQDLRFALILIAPAFILLGIVVFYPIIESFRISLLEYTIRTRLNPTWNAFENYLSLFQKGEIQDYFRVTLIYAAATLVVEFAIAFPLALMLNSKLVIGRNFLRGLFMISWVIPNVVAALLWVWMLQPQYGIFNYVLGDVLGLVAPDQNWTQHPQLAMVSIVLTTVWRQMPLMLIMFLAGLQAVPDQLLEAAKIDGATHLQIIRHIIVPLLIPVIGTTLLLVTVNNFQMFELIYLVTRGGPIGSTTTLAVATYEEAFTNFDNGSGAAIGVLWLISLVVITLFVNSFIARANPRKL